MYKHRLLTMYNVLQTLTLNRPGGRGAPSPFSFFSPNPLIFDIITTGWKKVRSVKKISKIAHNFFVT